MQIGERHRKILHGHGLCSVPMWSGYGLPAGFCDRPAFGEPVQPLSPALPYVPALACPQHGGPTLQEYIKGRTVIRFDGPPGPEAGRFVEVERDGASIRFGEWLKDGEDWLLVLPLDAKGDGDE